MLVIEQKLQIIGQKTATHEPKKKCKSSIKNTYNPTKKCKSSFKKLQLIDRKMPAIYQKTQTIYQRNSNCRKYMYVNSIRIIKIFKTTNPFEVNN